MNPAEQPWSAKRLANKRRQVKGKILLLQSRLTELEEDHQLPSLPEFRVFAKNIERYYGELDQVLQNVEESDLFADERDAHDMECAAIEGLLQGVNLKIVALSSALLSQPVQVTVLEQCQHQPPVSTGNEPADPAVAAPKVCAPLEPISNPPITTKDHDQPLLTRCDGRHLNTVCYTDSEVPRVLSQETNPNPIEPQIMPVRSLQQEKPFAEHKEIQPPAEPEMVRHGASARVRGDVDMSGDSGVPPTLRSEERIHGDRRRSTDRNRAAEKLAEKLLQSVILTSIEKQFRLVWDPGVQPSSASSSTTQLTEEHH
ncbi:uncharacterized protein LOC120414752 [Culex pipiens pallens]|uniref:uncharacterized protein LOC120414752 n=1 Tax=Culex pipiens pallens TaxID=42434 RepID=UPI0019536E28|nr:uncharacterized protein LOC120414752 [Culex pipiens pallens]